MTSSQLRLVLRTVIMTSSSGPTNSPQFMYSDADLSFLSSDGVVLKIHSKNLECASGGFAPADFSNPGNEIIPLPEDSETLEILFAFCYPRHHPDLENINFELLLKIAEAAEKYQVFGALNICGIRLRENVHYSPLRIFIHGFKHGRRDLISKAVPYLQDMPLAQVTAQMPPALVVPWVAYYEERKAKIMQAFLEPPFAYYPSPAQNSMVQNPMASGPLTLGFGRQVQGYSLGNGGLNDRTLADAMRRFYESNSATTSVEGLRVAIRRAFLPEQLPTLGGTVPNRLQQLQAVAIRVEEGAVDEFLRRLEEQLGAVRFDTYIPT